MYVQKRKEKEKTGHLYAENCYDLRPSEKSFLMNENKRTLFNINK